MRVRFSPAIRIAVALASLAMLSGSDHPASDSCEPASIVEGVPYAVEVHDGTATLDLLFDSGTRYYLILGSLDASGATHEVQLTAEPCDHPTRLAARRVTGITPVQRRPAQSRPSFQRDRLPADSGESPATDPASAIRTFFIHVTDGDLNEPRSYVRVVGRQVASGNAVRIYLDEKHPHEQLSRGLCDELVRLCDDEIIPKISADIGPCRDVDGDGRLAILLTPWLGALQGGRTSVGGFVRSTDFDPATAPPLGNQGDILYLNTSLSPGPALKTLLAHEFTHAVAISARLPSRESPYGRPHEEDWVSEGTAHLAERAYGGGWSNLDYRIDEYLRDPGRYPLVVPDYYRAGLWRCHGCRGATWLFLQWCTENANPDLLRDLVHARGVGIANVERATGTRFEDLFRQWSLAVLCSGGGVRAGAGGNYRAIDLHGRTGSKVLSGPRVEMWDVAQLAARLNVASTAFTCCELVSTESGAHRIDIDGPKSLKLQVTLLRSEGKPTPSERPNPSLVVSNQLMPQQDE